MKFLDNILNGENQTILFFILIFLFLFYNTGLSDGGSDCEDSTILFFVIIFLLLNYNNDFALIKD
jgi:hypothetical protein